MNIKSRPLGARTPDIISEQWGLFNNDDECLAYFNLPKASPEDKKQLVFNVAGGEEQVVVSLQGWQKYHIDKKFILATVTPGQGDNMDVTITASAIKEFEIMPDRCYFKRMR